jgi:mono/diheme cytochrome c family protein
MKRIYYILTLISAISLVSLLNSCKQDTLSPGIEYMPDMYRTQAAKAYVDHGHPDSMLSRKPVVGTIPYSADPVGRYNNLPYQFSNTPEGYEASANLKNPVPFSDLTLEEGKILYGKYCVMCHGDQGKGDGTMVQRDKFPPPPSYSGQLKDLPTGKMFHVVTYGKGLMGSHASQVTKWDRWKIIHYVEQLQKL